MGLLLGDIFYEGCVDSCTCMNEANELPFVAMVLWAGAVRMGSLEEEVKSGSPGRVGEVEWGTSLSRLSCLLFVEPSWALLNLILFCPHDGL